MKNKLIFLTLFSCCFVFSQNKCSTFFTPSDTLNIPRRNAVVITQSTVGILTLVGLNQLWYKDYPKSSFHTINDANEWLQMDKAGHVFSSYHLGKIGAETLNWAGVSKRNQLYYGATMGLAFLSVVEVFDGYSSRWGFSYSDMIANVSGTGLYISQELLWKEQRIIPKFSFHKTNYASLRPQVLGSSFSEQLLKDYNGQTYWLSANMHSFFKKSYIPKWLNVAIGYGADGMITGNDINNDFRMRKFYLSVDIDLRKIPTKSHFLKTIFEVFNTVKIPAPTFEFNTSQGVKFHYLYF